MKRAIIHFSYLVVIALLVVLPSCGDSPTDATDAPPSEVVGRIEPGGGHEFLLGTVASGPVPGRIEVWVRNLSVETDRVSFDAVLLNASRRDIPGPLYFVVTEIRPPAVEVANADFVGDHGPVFDFGDDVGDDGILSAGERSAPVTMSFTWPEPMAFSIAFRIEVGEAATGGHISGIVFEDLNRNGTYEPGLERGIQGMAVELVPSVREIVLRTKTDRTGGYVFEGLPADVYKVRVEPRGAMMPTTPNPLIVTLVVGPDGKVTGLDRVNFGFAASEPPPPSLAFFGPVPVGPGSPHGTSLDSTFVVPNFFAAVDLYLRVVPPPILGPYPLHIDEASVSINDVMVWSFSCPVDSVCTPADRVLLDSSLAGENKISIRATGDPRSFLMFSLEAETILPPR